MQVFRVLLAIWSLFLFALPALALEGAEATLEWNGRLTDGQTLTLENLLGTIRLVAGTSEDGARVVARVAAEAGSAAEAAEWANSILLRHEETAGATLLHVVFPTDRSQSFRPPKAGLKGLWSRWSAPLLRGSSSVEYDGTRVQLGSDRKATGLAVDLTIELPHGRSVIVHQGAGSIGARALRGSFDLTTIDGDIELDRCFGSIAARNTSGEIAIRGFQGETLEAVTGGGEIRIEQLRAERIELRSDRGAIRGSALQSDRLIVQSESGDIELQGAEPAELEIRTVSADVDLASYFRQLRQASIQSATGDVTLRVGELTHFDLAATTRSGEVKTLGLSLEVLEADGNARRLRHGRGGPQIEAGASGGSVTVRPYDASRMSLLLRESERRR